MAVEHNGVIAEPQLLEFSCFTLKCIFFQRVDCTDAVWINLEPPWHFLWGYIDSDIAVSQKNRYSFNNWMVKSFILPIFLSLQKKWVKTLLGKFHHFKPEALNICKTVISTGIEPALNGKTPWFPWTRRLSRPHNESLTRPRCVRFAWVFGRWCETSFFVGWLC